MKYKVGDKVKVHDLKWFQANCDLEYKDVFSFMDNYYYFSKEMQKYCGKIVIILDVYSNCYTIESDDELWRWQDWMFEDMNKNTNTIFNPNIVEDFAKLIGVELDEEFYDKENNWRYKFTADNGLMVYDDTKEDWRVAFAYSLTAFFKTIKEGRFIKNWMPKDGDEVYFPSFCCEGLHEWTRYYSEYEHDKEMLKNGLYFRTKEEAVECTKKMIKSMKEG